MKSIAVIGPSWPFRSGIARETTLLAKSLEERGSLAAFLTPFSQFPGFLYPGSDDRDPHFCPNLDFAQPSYSIWQPNTWRHTIQAVRESKAQVVVTPYWTAANAPFFSFLSAFVGLPIVAVVHNAADHEGHPASRFAAELSLRGASAYLCHSHWVADNLRQNFPSKSVVHKLIPPPPKDEGPGRAAVREKLGVKDDEVLFFFAGLIRPYKGLFDLLAAMTKVSCEHKARLVIAGEAWDPSGEMILAKVRELGLEDRVILRLGWQSPKDFSGLFEAADVITLPYHSSYGSGVAATALAHGLPLLVSEPLADAVVNKITGRVVAPKDVQALADAVMEFCHPETRAKLAAGAKAKANSLCWTEYASVVENLCEKVVGVPSEERVWSLLEGRWLDALQRRSWFPRQKAN
jgi:D-inositol-3-phosphate glycosyltransferase